MRIDEAIRKCVAFVGVENNGQFIPTGTGFLIAVRYEHVHFHFLVTADHVLNSMHSDTFAIRLNRREGFASSMLIDRGTALRHPNKANDVAVVPVVLDGTVYDVLAFEMDRKRLIKKRENFWDIALGDEVCAIGLYTSHHGKTKNIPIVRTGNLAALCEEPVNTAQGAVDAYLIELRTIAGLSGSPVFVVAPPVNLKDGKLRHQMREDGFMGIVELGILVGYHVVETKEDQVQVPRFQGNGERLADADARDYSQDERNTGFGVVIPIERVMDILEQPNVKEEMERIADEWAKKNSVKPAAAPQPVEAPQILPSEPDNPSHREDFNRLLGAAVRKPKQDDQT